MIFWRGYGIFVLVLTVVGYLAARFVAERYWGTPLPSDVRPGAELVGMFFAAGLVFAFHLALERSSKPRAVIDKETGKEFLLKAKHDLFFIPVRFWPYVLAAFGVLFYFQR